MSTARSHISSNSILFQPFRLDVKAEQLWRGLEKVALKPKALGVLMHLALRPRELVSKSSLVEAVWKSVSISSATLRSTVRELRDALGDSAESPQYIETVHGKGYRFVAPIGVAPDSPSDSQAAPAPGQSQAQLQGRDRDLQQLERALSAALEGQRQLVFVTGEPGIGKTTLVETFASGARESSAVAGAHGQCISSFGDDEPFLPILEALGRLCRQPGGRRIRDTLAKYAPTWMVEMPGLLEPAELRRSQLSAVRVDRNRMLGELAIGVEAICAEQPLILLFEDLHWSDTATLDAIDVLARRTEAARLLLIGTHRPVPTLDEVGGTARLANLRAELGLHDLVDEISLSLLSRDETRAYLDHRCEGLDPISELTDFVYGRSQGNPLMIVGHLNALVQSGKLFSSGDGWQLQSNFEELPVPRGLSEMVEYQLDQLASEERQAIEIASVAGMHFTADDIPDGRFSSEEIDVRLLQIARRHQLLLVDGDAREFVHSLHQELAYGRIAPSRRRELHLEFGNHLEQANQPDTHSVAAQLVMHFERGGEVGRAIQYLTQTAELAIQRSAHAEAEALLRRAAAFLDVLPASDDRARVEFAITAQLGNALALTKGYIDPEVHDAYRRAIALSESIDDNEPDLITALAGLHGYYELRADHLESAGVAQRLLRVAEQTGDSYDRVVASLCRGTSCFSVGDYAEAARQLTTCIETYDAELHGPSERRVATDHGSNGLGYGSLVFAAQGQLGKAREWSARSLGLARELEHVPSEVVACYYAMTLEQLLRHVDRADRFAARCRDLSIEHGFPYFIPATLVVSGWAQARRGEARKGAERAFQGAELLRAAGAQVGQPLWSAMVGEAHLIAGDFDAGIEVVVRGLELAAASGEVASEPSLHWVKGELVLCESPVATAEAEHCYQNGIDVAARCGSPTQALGPAMSLAKLWREQGRTADAKRLLEKYTQSILEAPEVPVLDEAEKLLRQC